MLKLKEFIQRAKTFINENPQRKKFLLIIFIAAIIPLTVLAALTIQDLRQRAGGTGVQIVDVNGNYLPTTSDTQVYLRINLPENWVWGGVGMNENNFIKQAYAQVSCGDETCSPGQTCQTINEGDGTFSKICVGTSVPTSTPTKTPTPTSGINITASPTLAPILNPNTCNPACNSGETCKSVNEGGTISYICEKNPTPVPSAINLTGEITCPSDQFPKKDGVNLTVTVKPPQKGVVTVWEDGTQVGAMSFVDNQLSGLITLPSDFIHPTTIEIKFATQQNQNAVLATATPTINCPYFGKANVSPTSGPSPTPIPNILQAIYIENKDSDGSYNGNAPLKITSGFESYINTQVPWKLNDLLPSQNQATRLVQVTFLGSQDTVYLTATVTLVRSVPTVVPPVSSTVPTCKIGVNIFEVSDQCTIGGYRSTYFECQDGYHESFTQAQESPATCKSSDVWRAQAELTCKDSSSCNRPTSSGINYDLNGDGVVNCKDTKILFGQYGQKGTGLSADFNQDGTVGGIDFNILIRNYTPGDTTVCN